MELSLLKLSDLQVIILNSVFDQIDNNLIGELFIKLLRLKKNGYLSKHSNRFLPVGTHDFFGTHLILTEKKSRTPILCSKVISYRYCDYYNTPFPLTTLEDVLNDEQQKELKRIISQRIEKGQDVSYSGGLTINPDFKGFGQSQLFKDIYTGIHYLIHEHYNYQTMMGLAIPKVGTDVFFKTWGVKKLTVNGEEMRPTPVPFTNGAESILMWGDLENLSPYKKEMAKKFYSLWEERIEYSINDTRAQVA